METRIDDAVQAHHNAPVSDDSLIRVLEDPPLDGPTNMGRDEALLLRASSGPPSQPTLRIYTWIEPTVSLGYFQPYAEFERLGPPVNQLAVVRRPTGGGAILHDLEMTYSLTAPLSHPICRHGTSRLYEWAHDAVIASLKTMGLDARRDGPTDDSGPQRGPFFCFERRHRFDVLIHGDKIAGSAQRRTKAAVLQHGSIILANRFPVQPVAPLGHEFDNAMARIRSCFASDFAASLDLKPLPGRWTPDELESAATLSTRHRDSAWLRRT
jgi:lipoate-protein ligase A